MSDFSNLDYLYDHLPARYRREDKTLFLKRFLQFFGGTLDEWDEKFEQFFNSINPETATEEFIDFWLASLFGWSWFPKNFTLQQKRTLYANFASHLARRGTARGIELWLKDFGANAIVGMREGFWDDEFYGEPAAWTVDQPLALVVEIISLKDWESRDLGTMDEDFWDDACYWGDGEPRLTDREIEILLKFVQPAAQEIKVTWRRYERV